MRSKAETKVEWSKVWLVCKQKRKGICANPAKAIENAIGFPLLIRGTLLPLNFSNVQKSKSLPSEMWKSSGREIWKGNFVQIMSQAKGFQRRVCIGTRSGPPRWLLFLPKPCRLFTRPSHIYVSTKYIWYSNILIFPLPDPFIQIFYL